MNTSPPDHDTTLWKQWQEEGDRSAADRLYRKHVRAVVRSCLYRVRHDPDRDALAAGWTNAAFVHAARTFDPGQGVGEDPFLVWWRRLTVNAILDEVRRKRPLIIDEATPDQPDKPTAVDRAPSHEAPPDVEAEVKQFRDWVEATFTRWDWEAIWLSPDGLGYTWAEVADRVIIDLEHRVPFETGTLTPAAGASDILDRISHEQNETRTVLRITGHDGPDEPEPLDRAASRSLSVKKELQTRRRRIADFLELDPHAGRDGTYALVAATAETRKRKADTWRKRLELIKGHYALKLVDRHAGGEP